MFEITVTRSEKEITLSTGIDNDEHYVTMTIEQAPIVIEWIRQMLTEKGEA
jgi:hypothetical protein